MAENIVKKENRMNTRKNRHVLFLSALLVISLACSSLSELSATATPLPTSTFTPTPPPTLTPTPQGPVAADGSTIVTKFANLELASEPYNHPKGWVSFYPMKGWEIETTDFDVTMSEPSTDVTFYITATNTGITLDEEAYANFRNNLEAFYAFQDQYEEINSGSNEAINLYFIEKQYMSSDGSAKIYGVSIYQQFDQVIYAMEMFGSQEFVSGDSTNPYRVMFDSFLRTIETDSSVASSLPLYQYSWSYESPQTGAALTVPWAWSFDVIEESGSYMAVFNSPDGKAGARMFTGASVKATGEVAKKFGRDATLAFLTGLTGDDGVKIITGDGQAQDYAPGVYMFGWEAPAAGWTGVALYDTNHFNQNQMVITVVFSETASLNMYTELLGRIGDSYTSGQ